MSALQATAMANVQGCQEHLNVTGGHRSVAGVAAMAIQILIGFLGLNQKRNIDKYLKYFPGTSEFIGTPSTVLPLM